MKVPTRPIIQALEFHISAVLVNPRNGPWNFGCTLGKSTYNIKTLLTNHMEAIERAKQARKRRDTPEGNFAAWALIVGSFFEAISILLLWLLRSQSRWFWRWIARDFAGRREDETSDEEAMASSAFGVKRWASPLVSTLSTSPCNLCGGPPVGRVCGCLAFLPQQTKIVWSAFQICVQ